jgi:hypothetical protein
MSRIRLALVAAIASVTVALPAYAVTIPTLTGTVGPGFTITIRKGGRAITTPLKRGRYTVTVSDRSPFHNFRLRGPGVNRAVTGVGFEGRRSVTVTLRPGRYTILCDPHPVEMRKTFRVA